MIFDDGKQRVELRYFGIGHTRGDGFAWLPKERILFTGDAAVNGPFNFMGDGDSAAWIETLAAVRDCPQRSSRQGTGRSATAACSRHSGSISWR